MSASKTCKALGAKSLAEVARATDMHFQTLDAWSREKPALFRAVVVGVVELKKLETQQNQA